MNILFIVPSYKPAYTYGGPIVVIALLAENLVRLGHTVTVYTTTANGRTELDVPPGKEVLVDGVKVTYFHRVTGDHTHASPGLWKQLNKTAHNYNVVHLHSWWNLLIIGAAWVCQRKNIVPVLSPHGMFSKYIFSTNNSGKKKLLHQFIGKSLLRKTRLHVSTALEWEESNRIIPNWQGAIIPNPVTLSSQVYTRPTNNVFTIGFLSRLDPKKGLDILLQALSRVNFSYRLLIAGDGEPTYVQSLKELAITLGSADKLEWVGWKNGEDKFAFLASLDLFALTSHSENFAIVVIEALSTGTPVMISDQVGLHSFILEHNYGWVTELAIDTITSQLNSIATDKAKAAAITAVAPSAIHAEYGGLNLAQQYVNLYQTSAQ
jgi:glycosyltransferase involved in cell wall biosynthesis